MLNFDSLFQIKTKEKIKYILAIDLDSRIARSKKSGNSEVHVPNKLGKKMSMFV